MAPCTWLVPAVCTLSFKVSRTAQGVFPYSDVFSSQSRLAPCWRRVPALMGLIYYGTLAHHAPIIRVLESSPPGTMTVGMSIYSSVLPPKNQESNLVSCHHLMSLALMHCSFLSAVSREGTVRFCWRVALRKDSPALNRRGVRTYDVSPSL